MKNGTKAKGTKAMKPLVLKFPVGLLDEISRVVQDEHISKSEFIREAIRCLTHLPAEHLEWLFQYAQAEDVRLSRLIREAVQLYITEKRGQTGLSTKKGPARNTRK